MTYDTFADSSEPESPPESADIETSVSSNVSFDSMNDAYSDFSIAEKRGIVFMTAFASLFSPLSSFIYYPAITYISKDLNVSIELINLTVTSYMVVSGIAPTLLGDLADQLGRRPIYLSILAIYVAANVGLACQTSYAALLVLRMVQSFGSSATIAIAYGVVGDIASPAERGSFTGLVLCGPNTAPFLGPVLGGALAEHLGWRWIFWFLVILAGACFTLLAFFFPETSRRIVGNGSVPAKGINRTLLSILWPDKRSGLATKQIPLKRDFRIPNPMTSLYVIFHKDIFLIMLVHGIFYMTYACIQASLSTLFMELYHFSGVEAGLMYLPFGAGCLLASYFTGKMLNRDYRITAKTHDFIIDELRGDDLTNFPIEKARLRSVFFLVVLTAGCVSGYGWSVERKMNIVVPLVFQFFVGGGTTGIFNALQTLLVDLHPDSPATAQAGLNMVRASLAACGTAALQLVIDSMGPGWCFTIFGGICLSTISLLWMENEWGMEWRLAKGQPISLEQEPLLI